MTPAHPASPPERDEEHDGRWVEVAGVDQLIPGRGMAALVGGRQVAIFLVEIAELHGDGARQEGCEVYAVYAVDNHDPFSGANVLSRGIVGDRAGVPKVASPVFKQSFDLRTGQCLDDDSVQIATFPTRISAGRIEVAVTADTAAAEGNGA